MNKKIITAALECLPGVNAENCADLVLDRIKVEGKVIVDLGDFQDVKCRHGCDEVAGVFYIPKGCQCFSDPVQALCGQHAIKAQSEGPITLLVGENPRGWSKHER